jgi:hypothetical protein
MILVADNEYSRRGVIPDGASLKIGRSAGKNSSRNGLAGFASVHDTLGDGRVFAYPMSVK